MRSWRWRGRGRRRGVKLVRQQDVFERGKCRDELVGLEDKADRLAAHLGEAVFFEMADVDAVEEDFTPAG